MKKQILIPALSLFLICAITSLLLAAANEATCGPIAELQAQTALEAQQTVLPTAASFEEKTAADGTAYAQGLDASGQTVGYVFTTSSSGYGGLIKVMTGVDNGGAITGVELLEISETAGLGSRVNDAGYLAQYKGSAEAKNIGQIDVLTGATVSSKAVMNGVNSAIEAYSVYGGEGNE